MQKLKTTILMLLTIFVIASCEPSKSDDEFNEPLKKGSVVIELSTTKLNDKNDVLKIYYTVYNKYGNKFTEYVICDTIPSLGTVTENAYDKDDNEIKVNIPKEYEFFVTLK